MNLKISLPATWQKETFEDWYTNLQLKVKESKLNQDIKTLKVVITLN